jgi:hypothetical protein
VNAKIKIICELGILLHVTGKQPITSKAAVMLQL